MRRTLRPLTITSAAITALALTTAPALAEVTVDNQDGGGSAVVDVEANSPGKNGGSSKPSKPRGENKRPGKTNINPPKTTPVGNYTKGDPAAPERSDRATDLLRHAIHLHRT